MILRGAGQRLTSSTHQNLLPSLRWRRCTLFEVHLTALRCAATPGRGGPTVAQSSSKDATTTGASKVDTPVAKEKDTAEDALELPLSMDPVSITVVEATITGLFVIVLAGVLGGLLNIDPWSYYTWDSPAAWLALSMSLPVALALVAVAVFPTGVLPAPTQQQRQLMSKAEDDVITTVQVLDIGNLLFPAAGAQLEPQPPALAAATTNPIASGLRLFQLYVTKPWFPEFSAPQMVAITAASGLQLTAVELMARGLIVALLAHWARETVASSDSTSLLFWGKVFRLSSQDTYRWFGTWVIAALSMYTVSKEADRMRRWARLVMSRMEHGEAAVEHTAADKATDTTTPAAAAAAVSVVGLQQQQQQEAVSSSTLASTSQSEASGTAGVVGSGITSSSTAVATAVVVQPAAAVSSTEGAGAAGLAHDATAAVAAGAGQPSSSSSGSGELDAGMSFTGVNRTARQSITVSRTFDSIQVELTEGEVNLPPTTEDNVVYSLAMAAGAAQVVLLAVLFGSTGTLVAPLVARMVQEVIGNALVRANAKGGPAVAGNPLWQTAGGGKSDSDDDDK